MKKVKLLFLVMFFGAFASIAANVKPTPPSFFPTTGKVSDSLGVYMIDTTSLTPENMLLMKAIQGISSKDQSNQIYLYTTKDSWYLPNLKDQEFQVYTGNLKILQQMFKNDKITPLQTKSISELLKYYIEANIFKGYFTYDISKDSKNLVMSYAGIKNYLPVTVEQEKLYDLSTLKIKTLNTTDTPDYFKTTTQSEFLKTYKKEINTKVVFELDESSVGMPRDYAIKNNALIYYNDTSTILGDIGSANSPIAVIGWNDEQPWVKAISKNGDLGIPGNWAMNLSILSSSPTVPKKSKYSIDSTKIKYDSSKKYITFLVSDGDNLQLWNNMINDARFWGNKNRKLKGKNRAYPVGWTVPPSMFYLAPDAWNFLIDTADASDEFIVGPSGIGYTYAGVAKNVNKFDAQLTALNNFVDDSNVNTVTLFGVYQWSETEWMEKILDKGGISGGFYCGYPAWPPITSGLSVHYLGSDEKPIMYVNGYLDGIDDKFDTTQQFLAVYVCKNLKTAMSAPSYVPPNTFPSEETAPKVHVMDLIQSKYESLKDDDTYVIVSPSEMIAVLQDKHKQEGKKSKKVSSNN